MSQQITGANRARWILAIVLATMFAVIPGRQLAADDGVYRQSPHGSTDDGVWRRTDVPRGSCAQCHNTHDAISGQAFGLFEPNTNQLCFAASAGGCHADLPTGATAGYPAQESDRMPIGSADPGYFEFNAGGLRVPGVQNLVRWPGRTVWESPLFSPHYSDQDMPLKDLYGDASCDNCHNPHGTNAPHDMLDTTGAGITGSDAGFLPENYALCLDCHSIDGPIGMDDTSRSIAYFYDRSMNPGGNSGHGIGSGGGYVSAGSRLPCYDCHNPHGSQGYGGQGGNDYLLSDQRPGWFGLTDIRNDNDQVRRFCFGCHPPSDNPSGAGPVEGLTLATLPVAVADHATAGTTHCYNCHGRDYSSPTANNIHNPAPGGDCVTCHATARGPRRAVLGEFALSAHHAIAIGQNGTVTNGDCGVCHMEGSAATGDVNDLYHANGTIELRDPDNGFALPGFFSLTRDRNSAMLESSVVDVQNNFCLKCHDANGALSLDARFPGASATAPFSDPNAMIIDVFTDFDPANASFHPVRAAGDNPYTIPSSVNGFVPTLEPPFNQTALHDLISCFDCHQTNGHGSDTSGLLLTETYFRNAALNPSYSAAQRQFCGTCHSDLYYTSDSEGHSRFKSHDRTAHVEPGGQARNGQSCRGCHAGIYDADQDPVCDNGSRIGSIHGSNYMYGSCSPTPGVTPVAFLFGGYLNGWHVANTEKNECYANCHHGSGQEY